MATPFFANFDPDPVGAYPEIGQAPPSHAMGSRFMNVSLFFMDAMW